VSNITEFRLTSKQDGLTLEFDHFWAQGLTPDVDKPNSIVLMIHGYGDNKPFYTPLADYIAQGASGSNVVTFDQREHGINMKDRTPPSFTDTEAYEEDVLQVLEHLRETYPETILYVYGHSMGGAIALGIGLTQPNRVRKVKVNGFILESPYLKVHADTGKWHLMTLAKILGWLMPNLTLPDELKAEYCVRDEEIRGKMMADTHRAQKCRAGTAKCFIEKGIYFDQNGKNWPKDFPVQLHVPRLDRVCDSDAAHCFFNNISEANSRNERIVYEDACHDIKADLREVREQFFENVSRYIRDSNECA